MFERSTFRDFSRILRHALFACMIFVFGGTGMAYAYTVTYDCGFYTGTAPASATATANASFTPPLAASGCNPCDSTTTLTGWAVSGTSDVKTPGTAFTWDYDENKTFTAVWSKYPNIDNTDCVVGYKITLNCISNGAGVIDPCPAPRYLWTIPTVGAYLDPGRTQLMTSDAYNIVMPSRQPLVVNFDTNAPYNPAVNPTVQYTTNPATVATITKQCWYTMRTDDASNLINQYGFISSAGTNRAASRNADEAWRPTQSYGSSSTPNLSLTGYNFDGWYNNQNGTGTRYTRVYIPDNTPSPLYAHWTPKKYNVVYNKGAHATSGSTDYTDTNGATYDSPYTPLSFSSTPISNSMSADTGYVFAGWTEDPAPTFTNGNLNNQYTGDTYWKRDSGLTLYAAYDCDVENGYHWNNNECVLNMSTVTYYSGNCDPNNVKNPFGNTYSATDLNSAVIGQPYNVLSYTNTSLVGDNFGYMYGSVADGGFGVPYACASFHGWNNPNIQGTDKDYTGCFSEQNGLCTPVIQSYNYDGGLNLYAYCEWGKWNVAYHDCNGELLYTQAMQFGDSFWTPSASDVSGYTFNGWTFNNLPLGETFPADLCLKGQNLNLYANCKPNVYPVNLKWVADGDTYNQNPDTCDYGTSTISGISHPDIPGYTFTGWKVTNWE